jgi:hypothetical protein
MDVQGIEPWTLYTREPRLEDVAFAKHTRYHCAKRPYCYRISKVQSHGLDGHIILFVNQIKHKHGTPSAINISREDLREDMDDLDIEMAVVRGMIFSH